MLETTGDLKLKKIELTDTPDITVINPNWDKLDEEITRSKTNIGNITQLTTQNKTSLVDAINEIDTKKIAKTQIKNNLTETIEGNVLDATMGKALKDDIDNRALKTEVGTLSGLATTVKTSIVNAINEISGYIGKLQSLATNAKTSLVDAINENTNEINVLLEKAVTGCEYKSILNLNDITKTDLYQYSDFSTEGRVGAPDNYVGVVFHKQLASGYAFQTAWSMSGKRYERKQLASIWSDWEPQPTATKTDILTDTLVNGWVAKYGDVVLNVTGNQAVITGTLSCGILVDGTTVMTVPSKYRPTTRSSHCTIGTFKGNEQGTFTIYVDGTIKYRGGSITGTTDIAFCFTYILY